MFYAKKFCFLGLLLGAAATAHAQPGIIGISFTDTAMSATGSWPVVPSPNVWTIRAILTDASHKTIGTLSLVQTLNTASAASYPTGFRVRLGENAPAGAIVIVYRSPMLFDAGAPVDKAEYTGLCDPIGCVAGELIVPVTGQLLNSDFTSGSTAMPVRLQSYSVD
jgi:hypothetical protein